MSARSIHLTDARFAELLQVAQAQGRTPDELADEAIAALVRRRRLDSVMEFGQRHTQALGIAEGEVERLISEVRVERRHGNR